MNNESIQPLSLPVKAGIILLMIGLLYTAYVAVCRGLADYYAEDAFQITQAWHKGEKFTEERWQDAHDAMVKALDLDPTHPTYLHRMGRLYHIRMVSRYFELDEFKALGDKAKQYYRDSTGMRRTWPATWANLALVKKDLIEFDEEMDEAIRNAVTYGPWEPDVHRMIAIVGLSRWYLFKPEIRLLLAGNLKRGLLSPTANAWNQMMAIIDRYPAAIQGEFLDAITSMLMDEEWDRWNQLEFTQMGFRLYGLWSRETRDRFQEKLLNAIRRGEQIPALMNLVKENNQLVRVCPWLPRSDAFKAFCTNIAF
jgi:hypothetical protein